MLKCFDPMVHADYISLFSFGCVLQPCLPSLMKYEHFLIVGRGCLPISTTWVVPVPEEQKESRAGLVMVTRTSRGSQTWLQLCPNEASPHHALLRGGVLLASLGIPTSTEFAKF